MFCFTDVRQDVGNRNKRRFFDEYASRKHFITKPDISNIRVKIKDNTTIRHKDDALSVSGLVAELQEEKYNPVLLFKKQGEESSEYPSLGKEGFMLVLQTQFQREMFQTNGHKILCIDATHGTNAYRFLLITCIVLDEYGKGICY